MTRFPTSSARFLFLVAAASPFTLARAQTVNNAPFADALTGQLYEDGNECTSSLGISMAMSLVYPSAISDSELQMRTVMGYPAEPESQSVLLWENTTDSLTTRYQGNCYNEFNNECQGQDPTVEIANSVFVDERITLNATYEAVVGEFVQQIDFQDDQAGSIVNSWVNDNTNGLIDSIVEDGSLEPWIVLIVNSIYLKASWSNQFQEGKTNEDAFYGAGTGGAVETSQAHFMHIVESFPYSHDAIPGYQILQHPFAGSGEATGLSMIFALPLPGSAADSMVSSEQVLGALDKLEYTRIALALPKFKYESKYEDNLKAALQDLGMTAPFDSQNTDNLCIADGTCEAFIDVIIQKTIIDVNENGVEAAAVTALGIALTSLPPPFATLFLADRPFQFFIHDQVENVVLFEGRVAQPGIPEGSTAPLQAKHSDTTDFWFTNFGINATMPEMPATPPPTPATSEETAAETTTMPGTTDAPTAAAATTVAPTSAAETTTTDAPSSAGQDGSSTVSINSDSEGNTITSSASRSFGVFKLMGLSILVFASYVLAM